MTSNRTCMITEVKPGKIDEYRRYHDNMYVFTLGTPNPPRSRGWGVGAVGAGGGNLEFESVKVEIATIAPGISYLPRPTVIISARHQHRYIRRRTMATVLGLATVRAGHRERSWTRPRSNLSCRKFMRTSPYDDAHLAEIAAATSTGRYCSDLGYVDARAMQRAGPGMSCQKKKRKVVLI